MAICAKLQKQIRSINAADWLADFRFLYKSCEGSDLNGYAQKVFGDRSSGAPAVIICEVLFVQSRLETTFPREPLTHTNFRLKIATEQRMPVNRFCQYIEIP